MQGTIVCGLFLSSFIIILSQVSCELEGNSRKNEESADQLLLRRQLGEKRRKLRKLRTELRTLRERMHAEDTQPLDFPSSDEATGRALVTEQPRTEQQQQQERKERKEEKKRKKKKKKKVNWRKKLLKELRLLNRRLDVQFGQLNNSDQSLLVADYIPIPRDGLKQLEKDLVIPKETEGATRKQKKNGNRQQTTTTTTTTAKPSRRRQKPKSTEAERSKNEKAIEEARHKHKISALNTARNHSKRGEEGSECGAHRDCRPGLCCHQYRNQSAVDTVCMTHSLVSGSECSDSCECAAGLHCYWSRKDRSHQKHTVPVALWNTTATHERTTHVHGSCKMASTNDFMHGSYLNAKDAVFYEQDS